MNIINIVKKRFTGLLCGLVLCTVIFALACPVSSAAESKVKSNEDLAGERLIELQTKGTSNIEKAASKTQSEKGLYKYKIEDLNEEIEVSASLDSSTLVCGKTTTGQIKIKDLGKDHKLRDIRIRYSDLSGLPGVSDGYVKITHYNDAGIIDAVWLQEIKNDNGYAYIEDVPFSEVVIGGFVGTYTKSGTVTYPDSTIFSLGSTFDAENVNFIDATVTPTYTKDSPYDIPTDGLVGWWRFDEDSGTLVQDYSGNGNDGTASGMSFIEGKYNNAGSFDGVNDVVQITDSTTTVFTNNVTVLATIQRGNTGAFSTIIGKADELKYFRIESNNNLMVQLTFSDDSTTGELEDSALVIADMDKHFVGYTFSSDTGEVRFYVDGLLKKTYFGFTGKQIKDSISSISIGATGVSSTPFNGTIDNVMIYNKTLSDNEIKQIYYDNIKDLQLKTNSGSTYSNQIDESGEVSIPYDSEDNDISSLSAYVPDSVNIGGVTVNDYTDTVTPFNISAEVGYTENTTEIDEVLTDNTYEIYIRFVPGNDYSSGEVSYTAEANDILSSSLLSYELNTNDENAVLSYNSGTRTFTVTSSFIEGQTYNYKITCTNTGTVIPYLPSIDGFGDPRIEVYEAEGNDSYLIAASYNAIPRSDISVVSGFGSSIVLVSVGFTILAAAAIIGILRRVI
ncbi:LamG-like jellyroll fold domain-containing protein [Methanosarcina acetivorans]|nr:LamG-like jellyroll fold domain-containing protein [Methanosarcina acetivorans]